MRDFHKMCQMLPAELCMIFVTLKLNFYQTSGINTLPPDSLYIKNTVVKLSSK